MVDGAVTPSGTCQKGGTLRCMPWFIIQCTKTVQKRYRKLFTLILLVYHS